MPDDATPSGLLILHGNRAELLMQAVTAWLAANPLAPLEEDVVLVQSNGMAEWLKMTLAQQAGVCAATRVELPARFQWRLYRQTLGRRAVPTHSPLDKTPMTWRIMALLGGGGVAPDELPLLQQPAFAPVAGFLQGDEPERPLQLARRLADLFDQYQIYRADWLDDWAAGRDVMRRANGQADPVPPDQAWQPALWRALLAPLDDTGRAALRPALQRRVLQVLRSGEPTAAPLPRRVLLFGMTHLPLATLDLLAALGTRCQVMLAVPNPCRFHWADTIDGRELLRAQARRHPHKAGRDLAAVPLDALHAHAHPLLAAWGRQSRDFIRQLDAHDDSLRAAARAEVPRVDLFDDDLDDLHPAGPCLLVQVQQRIRDLVPLAEHAALATPLADDDRSIVFHVAHSAMREVEVLHDQLLHLLAQAPCNAEGRPLAPRDVVVMVPDIAAFEPAIRAVFGQHGRHDPRHIPYDIADVSARSASPLITALEWLLRLPQQRCTFSELRDLLDVPALARRHGLGADELPQLAHWMAGAGLRWGLGESQRGALGLGACGDINSALWAVRRLLLGYASGAAPLADGPAAEPAVFDGIEPHAEVGGLEAGLAGALAALVEQLARWWTVLRQPAPPATWAERARALLADFFTATDDTDRAALAALDEALDTWLQACEQAGFEAEVPLAVAREAWLDALDEPALNRRFRAGGVTFCTLMPMRAIPFEVVCLLGMNEGDYPRRAPRSDFDLLGQPGQARPGDRSRRDDDRQLMLEALLSARQRLHVSWTGRNVRDNTEQPPSVLVAQLRDYLAAGWGPAAVAQRTQVHPLQPFSRRYFEPQTVTPPAEPLFTYAREWRQAHQQAGALVPDEAHAPPATVPAFQPDPANPLTLARLAHFLRNPVKAHFRERLNVVFDEVEAEAPDDEAFALAGLEEYGLLDTLLHEAAGELEAHDRPGPAAPPPPALPELVARRLGRLRRSGQLPLGSLGQRAEAEMTDTLLAVLSAWQRGRAGWPAPAPRLPLRFEADTEAGPVRLDDWLSELRQAGPGPAGGALSGAAPGPDALPGPVQLHLRASRLAVLPKAKNQAPTPRLDKLVEPWLRTLVSAACGTPVVQVLVGRDATLVCHPGDADEARTTLARLLQAWCSGQTRPLPVALRTALAWLSALHGGAGDDEGEAGDPADDPTDPTAAAAPEAVAAAVRAATAAYDGGYTHPGEAQEPCLRRLWPDAETLFEADLGTFADWARLLYGPLHDWARRPGQVRVQLHAEAATDRIPDRTPDRAPEADPAPRETHA